jgi:hypothetical protein
MSSSDRSSLQPPPASLSSLGYRPGTAPSTPSHGLSASGLPFLSFTPPLSAWHGALILETRALVLVIEAGILSASYVNI